MPTEAEKLLSELNDEQKQAVTFTAGPLLIVAGAGTGKTTVVTKRAAWLVLNGLANTDQVLALTFTEKAAQEMEERIDRLLPYGYVDLWVSTFHSFGERILKNHALEIGLPNDFKLLDETQQWLLIRQNLHKFNLDYYKPLGNPSKFIHALLKHFSRAKDEEIYPDQYLKYAEEQKLNLDSSDEAKSQEIKRLGEVANAYHVYQQLLLDNNCFDFGDLINYTLRLFRQRPHLLAKYRQQFKYVLVDEFQDTNWAQYQMVKLLASPANNLTVVADDDQSIYKFRGACVSNILEFKKDYPTSQEVVLVNNYRSRQNILDLSYKFIQLNNPNRLEFTLKGLNKKLKSFNPGEAHIEHLHFGTESEEADGVVKKILDLKEKDPESTFNDFAVLVRANSQADAFVQSLIKHGLPFQFLASQGLYNKPIIIDIIAYLKLLDSYHESAALYRVLNLPFLKFPAADLLELLHYCRQKSVSLYQALKQAATLSVQKDTIGQIEKLLGYVARHTQLAREKKVSEVVLAFLQDVSFQDISYLKYLDQNDNQASRESLDLLNQFFKQIQSFEKESDDNSVKAFLGFINMSMEAGDEGGLIPDWESGPETIKVMTAHGSKGLEFDHVFVVNLVDRRFPTTEKSEAIELPDALIKEKIPEGDIHLQEERRLFYVAMTRAKKGLYFSSAEDYGGARKKKLSRFLIEAGLAAKEPPTEKGAKKSAKSAPAKAGLPILETFKPVNEAVFPLEKIFPSKFSFTQLKVFETCPWQYRYQHLLHIPVMGRHTFSFGKTMHLTLQKFLQLVKEGKQANQSTLFGTAQGASQSSAAGKDPSLDDLFKIYQDSWIDDWYEDEKHKEKYRQRGKQILRDFYKKHEGRFPVPKYLEQPFNLKIGAFTLKGQIDRIDPMPDGAVEIFDYKTGKVPAEDKLTKDQKDQLLIYQIASQEVLGEKVGKLTYYYLEENKPISFLGDPDELADLKEKIVDLINEMKKGEFVAKPNAKHCRSCDFKQICEYKTL